MSAPSYEEMEAKRQEMISSFREIAAAMARCVQVIEDYTALSPAHLSKPDFTSSSFAHPMSILPNGQLIADVLKKERKKKEKKPRDPNAPKRPPSAYILFQNEIRDDVRNSNPGMSYKDILGVISHKWKDLTDAQKKIYEEAYSSAHNNYVAEEKAYSAKPAVDSNALAIDPALTEDTSDSDDSDSDDTPPAKHKAPTTTIPLSHPNHFLPINSGMHVAPTTLHAATAGVPVPAPVAEKKKEKKRKNKDEAAVDANLTTDPAAEKKKKKKSKE